MRVKSEPTSMPYTTYDAPKWYKIIITLLVLIILVLSSVNSKKTFSEKKGNSPHLVTQPEWFRKKSRSSGMYQNIFPQKEQKCFSIFV